MNQSAKGKSKAEKRREIKSRQKRRTIQRRGERRTKLMLVAYAAMALLLVFSFVSPVLAQETEGMGPDPEQVDKEIVDPDAFLADMEWRDGEATCHFTNEASDQSQEQFCEPNVEGSVVKENSVYYLNHECSGQIDLTEPFRGVNLKTGLPVTFPIWYLYKTSLDGEWLRSHQPVVITGVCEGIFYLVDDSRAFA